MISISLQALALNLQQNRKQFHQVMGPGITAVSVTSVVVVFAQFSYSAVRFSTSTQSKDKPKVDPLSVRSEDSSSLFGW